MKSAEQHLGTNLQSTMLSTIFHATRFTQHGVIIMLLDGRAPNLRVPSFPNTGTTYEACCGSFVSFDELSDLYVSGRWPSYQGMLDRGYACSTSYRAAHQYLEEVVGWLRAFSGQAGSFALNLPSPLLGPSLYTGCRHTAVGSETRLALQNNPQTAGPAGLG